MTTTIENISTPLPTKTNEMSWDAFGEAIVEASSAEQSRLTEAIPTPAMTAEPGSDEWTSEWLAQRSASTKRSSELMAYNSQLILEIGRALAAELPNFRSLDVEYEGCGDSGEACEIGVYLSHPNRFDAEGNYQRPSQEELDERSKQQDAANNLLPSDLKEWMDETCWAIAYDKHPGFEIDAGGFGSIVVAPADEDDASSPLQLTISHTQRIEETYDDVVLA